MIHGTQSFGSQLTVVVAAAAAEDGDEVVALTALLTAISDEVATSEAAEVAGASAATDVEVAVGAAEAGMSEELVAAADEIVLAVAGGPSISAAAATDEVAAGDPAADEVPLVAAATEATEADWEARWALQCWERLRILGCWTLLGSPWRGTAAGRACEWRRLRCKAAPAGCWCEAALAAVEAMSAERKRGRVATIPDGRGGGSVLSARGTG